jgi:uncharacterized protein YkwD
MYIYSFSFEVFCFWFYSFIVICLISYLPFMRFKNVKINSMLALLILVFNINCSKDFSPIDGSLLSEEDISLALKVHNDARSEVGVPNLTWSNSLSEDALEWAKNMAEKDEMYHSSNDSRPGQGENLYYRVPITINPGKAASTAWHNEINDYTYAEISSPLNASVMIGHYTQMIWSSTTEVGMATARSTSGKEYVVARYSPPGNMGGQYPYKN